jgi:polar amino acid transport system substrate-binding protein
MDTDGKTPIGFDVDLGKALAAKLGVQTQFINTSFDGIFAGLDKGDYDCAISAITITKARVDNGNFCNPYVSNALALVGLKGSSVAPKDPMACTGLQVAYQAETTADYYMQARAKEGLKFTPREYDSVETAFTDMKLKRVDVVLTDSTVAADYLRDPNSGYVLLWQSAPSEFFGIALKKGNDALTQALNKAQDELFADGTMAKLSQKWLGGDMVSTAKGVTPDKAAQGAH